MKLRKVMRLLDNLSLIGKFAIIFIVCIFLPLILSGLGITINNNNRIYNNEIGNLKREYQRISSDISNIFTTALRNANVIMSDSNIGGLICESYDNERDFYNTLIYRDLKWYFNKYTSPNNSITDMTIYTDNYTVTDCDLLSKIDDNARKSIWYDKLAGITNTALVVPDRYLGNQGQFDNNTVSLVKHVIYNGASAVNGYIKIDMNISEMARRLNNETDTMRFYFYNDEYKCYIDPTRKRMLFYEGGADEFIKPKDAYIIDDLISSGKYLSNWRLVGRYDMNYIKRQQRNNILMMSLVCMGLGIISLALVYLIYCSNKRRIELLKRGMHDMVSEHFNRITDEPGRDEIAELITSYNYLSDRMSALINDVYKLEVRNKSAEIERVRAELKYLQSQINPHFIFNTLSALHIEALKNNCVSLAEHVYSLASVIRRILDRTEDLRPLYEELDFIRQYLELEKFRFQTKFRYEIDADDSAMELMTPPMIIQPLVENACRHGLQGKVGLREIKISVIPRNGFLRISVRDNGKGMNEKQILELRKSLDEDGFKGHIGIKNVYKRLGLYYGDGADIHITSKENEWTDVTLIIDMDALNNVSEL